MRESNFAFPAQNRACLCISSQLYDRRALDTNSPLPLFNSLTHLTYLTSTSPRIREIMTTDGGLERLVRILHDFCMCPPPPENPTIFYGLSPPSAHPHPLVPTLNPKSFDKQAQYRFSLAFQCVVNIGVRGNEPIRSRVVQAGTLDVVGCILEAWLSGRGFAVGPSVSATGMPRETREQRLARRQAQLEARQREQAHALSRALQRQVNFNRALRLERAEDDSMEVDPTTADPIQTDTSTDTSSNITPGGTDTPIGDVVPSRARSGTVVARPTWDQMAAAVNNPHRHSHRSRHAVPAASARASTSTSADNSRPETETEDDGDVDMDRESSREEGPSRSDTPSERRISVASNTTIRGAPSVRSRRAVDIMSDAANSPGGSLDITSDAHIIITNPDVAVEGVTVEDGLVSLEANDDFAMGAPPGAPGAIDGLPARVSPDTHPAGERTPRAGTANLPHMIPIAVPPVPATTVRVTGVGDVAGTRTLRTHAIRGTNPQALGTGVGAAPSHAHHHHARDLDSGPYRDEDVALSLQLLAYLSKYPHVRQAFYKPRTTFHPATAQLPVGESRYGPSTPGPIRVTGGSRLTVVDSVQPAPAKESNAFMRAFASATGRGKEKEKEKTAGPVAHDSGSSAAAGAPQGTPPRVTNIFALVERFTFRHSSADLDSPNPPPSLPPEIQYWAGVIMRNACRKDESRGGIRQCANMLCGRWESYPREFAKCRRCRKAKYCGKECQSTAWSDGHRFWCSPKDPEDDGEHHHGEGSSRPAADSAGTVVANDQPLPAMAATLDETGRVERRAEREGEAQVRPMPEGHIMEEVPGAPRLPPPPNPMRSIVSTLTINPNHTLAALNAPQSPAVSLQEDGQIARATMEDDSAEDMIIG